MNRGTRSQQLKSTGRKALKLNLDSTKYGTFAEIGAGQEVARHFFKVGGAAGTIASSISAYDMEFSDAIYGKCERYVSKDRLRKMLDHEYRLLEDRLSENRGNHTSFFVYANTVSARNYQGTNDCHGWMGIRWQLFPKSPPVTIIIHVCMGDESNDLQQDALGILGVNLIHAAFNLYQEPEKLIESLADNLEKKRIEVDMIEFSDGFPQEMDNRILSLLLVQYGLTNAVVFGNNGDVLQPSELFYKKNVILHRGSFRPFTKVNLDMVQNATIAFKKDQASNESLVTVMEITMRNLLLHNKDIDLDDFLFRVDTINALGYPVLVSNYFQYYRLSAYLRRFTEERVGLALGINSLLDILDQRHYENLDGGILESFGRLFKNKVMLYIYPMQGNAYAKFLKLIEKEPQRLKEMPPIDPDSIITPENLAVPKNLSHLYAHLLQNRLIKTIPTYNPCYSEIFSRQIMSDILAGKSGWESQLPEPVATLIVKRGLWKKKGS